MIPVTVCGEEMTRFQPLTADIVDDGFSLILIVGATVDDDTLVGIVADYVGVLLE